MQRSTLALAALVVVAGALIVLDRPSSPPAVAPAVQGGQATGGLPANHPPLNPAETGAGVAAQGPFGTVLESMNSGGYTYARVETSEAGESAEVWVAGPVTTLSVGDEVSLAGAMGMQNFRAASLDRTFDAILFVNRFAGPAGGGAGSAAPSAPGGAQAPAGAEGAGAGTVVEFNTAAGYTYVLVDQDGTRRWVAGESIQVTEGQTVEWDGGTVMQGFQSPSLGRTFDAILFANGLRAR